MSPIAMGAIGFAVLMGMLAIRIPIGVAMVAVGIGGFAVVVGITPLMNVLKTQMFYQYLNYDLSVIPLFLLMGQFAAKAGLSQALFRATNTWIGHHRGGIAMAAIGGCAGFGAISGSSLATAATMGQVSLPELRRHNYSPALATGTLAAGGTLGILIPPSVVLIIAAILIEANIEVMFQAAFLPGLIAVAGYMIAIAVVVRLDPEAGPAGDPATRRDKWLAFLDIWPVIVIFLLVIGGIYFGFFTPTQGASVGAIGTGLVALTKGGMRMDGFVDSVLGTARASALIFLILFGASMLNSFLGFTRLPMVTAGAIADSGLPPMLVLLVMVVIFLVLGMFMDSLSMILLFLPIFWPIMTELDFGLDIDDLRIWYGIIILMVVEIGLITPPIGLNVFVINSMAGDVPMKETFKGVVPFLMTDAVRVTILIAFPSITLLLPTLLRG
jgi:tripartite ATP-independent transporter DctM subunit